MNSSFINKYKPTIILTLALAVFLASCKAATTTPGWVVSTLADSTLGDDDGTGTAAQFRFPVDVAVDSSGNLYVADTGNHRIRKITPAGVVTTFAGSSEGDNKREEDAGEAVIGTAAKFDSPYGVAVDSSGILYVADTDNNLIRKITPKKVVTTFAGDGTTAQFHEPYGMTVDSFGNLYVADLRNHRIRKITPEGAVTTLAGGGTPAQFNGPSSVAVDSDNNVYVADIDNHRIRKITSKDGVVTVNTIAGTGTAGLRE